MKPLRSKTNIDTQRNTRDYPEGSVFDIIRLYKDSYFWGDLQATTKRNYNMYLSDIQEWVVQNKHPLIKNIKPKDLIGFIEFYKNAPVRQVRAKAVLSRLYTIAIQYGYVHTNPVKDIKLRRRQRRTRNLVLWQDHHVRQFVKTADAQGRSSMGTAVVIAYNTAQRQGDILRMQQPLNYCSGFMNVIQSKTGKEVRIPTTQELQDRLDTIDPEQVYLIINERTGKLWTAENFSHVFRSTAILAGLKDHRFMELRHSCVYQLNRAGCSPSQIAAITGHSLKTIDAMLAEHYLELRDAKVAQDAIDMLSDYRLSQGGTSHE